MTIFMPSSARVLTTWLRTISNGARECHHHRESTATGEYLMPSGFYLPTRGPMATHQACLPVGRRAMVTTQAFACIVRRTPWLGALCLALLCASCMSAPYPATPDVHNSIYETRAEHHPDGIGKFY